MPLIGPWAPSRKFREIVDAQSPLPWRVERYSLRNPTAQTFGGILMNKSLKVRAPFMLALLLASLSICKVAAADSIDILVGDKDGFGYGLGVCPDVGTCNNLVNPSIDNRSAAEAAATNGAQFTDVYSALLPGEGPNTVDSGDVIFDFTGTLTDATLSFAAGDFQSSTFGPFSATINGVSTPFSYDDGRFVTAIHSITLTAPELAAANAAGFVDLNLNRGSSGDFVAFDYFELTGDTTTSATPEPSTLTLFGTGILGLAAAVRRKLQRA
jgi:PEP-CTERM motif